MEIEWRKENTEEKVAKRLTRVKLCIVFHFIKFCHSADFQ